VDFWFAFLIDFLKQIPQFFLSPVFYLFLFFIFLQYRRLVITERRLFHVRITSPGRETLLALGYGAAGGVAASILLLVLGVALSSVDVAALWIVSAVLALFQSRFLSASYAAGLLGILSFIARFIPAGESSGFLFQVAEWLRSIHAPSLLALVAVLHLVEGVLLRRSAEQGFSPAFVAGKRGQIIGAYQIRKFWFFPLVLLFSGEPAGRYELTALSSWWPWFYGGTAALGLLPFPAAISYTDLAVSSVPQERVRRAAKPVFLYGIGLLLLAYAAKYWMPAGLLASIVALTAPEWMRLYSKLKQRTAVPFYVKLNKGVRVLAVIPGSPADEMEIVTGDIITRVNGNDVNAIEDIYPALQQQSAFCKMEVINREGHVKYVQRSLYQGDHHQLGIVAASDARTTGYVKGQWFDLFHSRIEIDKLSQGDPVETGQGKDVTL
jgi:hypothetical protein